MTSGCASLAFVDSWGILNKKGRKSERSKESTQLSKPGSQNETTYHFIDDDGTGESMWDHDEGYS